MNPHRTNNLETAMLAEPTPMADIEVVDSTAPRSMRVLVVDDNVDAADLLAEALSESGYEVRVAYDGVVALELSVAFHPEMALLDIGLPGMNGFELAVRLRALEGETLKLIAITGYGHEDDLRRAKESGFAVHLLKPVNLARLEREFARIRALP